MSDDPYYDARLLPNRAGEAKRKNVGDHRQERRAESWKEEARRLSDLLAQYERQCIPRTADMPKNALAWFKDSDGVCGYIHRISRKNSENVSIADLVVRGGFDSTPDFCPNARGPLCRAIVDVE